LLAAENLAPAPKTGAVHLQLWYNEIGRDVKIRRRMSARRFPPPWAKAALELLCGKRVPWLPK